MSGWIKLHRDITKNWLWQHPNYLRGWVWLLCEANYDDRKWLLDGKVMIIKRGDVVTSLAKIADGTGMSVQEVRTFLRLLIDDDKVQQHINTRLTHLTISNYELYQDLQQATNTPSTREQHASNNNIRNEEVNNTTTTTRAKKIPPNRNEVIAFFLDHGYGQDDAEEFFDYWEGEDWIRAGNQPIRSWQATARNRFKALKKFEANDNATTKGKHRSHSDAIENW